MLIQRIKISNYKTYLSLDLDLTVDDDRPIILIGGANGGGKTTLFEAISGALYGLKIENKEHFMELLNQGALNTVKPEISLQVTFVGKVLGQQQKYILKRVYQLNPQGKPLESFLVIPGNPYPIPIHPSKVILGIGVILFCSQEKPFESFEDITKRIPSLNNPAEMIVNRVKQELDTTTAKKGKKKYYLFTPIPKAQKKHRK